MRPVKQRWRNHHRQYPPPVAQRREVNRRPAREVSSAMELIPVPGNGGWHLVPRQTALHQPCRCPDYTRTLHGGEHHCPRRGLPSAYCHECGGCKFCRLAAEGEPVAAE